MFRKVVFFCIILFSLGAIQLQATEYVHADSSVRIIQNVDTALLNQLRAEKDFIYFENIREKSLGWWDLVVIWFMKALNAVFSNAGITPYLRYLVIGLIFIFLMIRLLGAKFQGIMEKPSQPTPVWNDWQVSADPSVYDEKIDAELRAGNLRNAVRLIYFQLLLLMDKKKWIRLRQEKTGRDYLAELGANAIAVIFRNVNRTFEYTWYGEFNPDAETFASFAEEVKHIKESLK